ncbi:DNA/RNA non-specific endonuclease [Adlercreutzia mucosicola]|uniref:DNA/RNA non-specific endonuclease n=1 Tax=Adlercreutzia mucosicola TaxID=580026 RepID=UPI00214C4853
MEDGVPSFDPGGLPEYAGHPFDIVNDNVPTFSEEDKAVGVGCERYSELDEMGRCGAAFALVSEETMPEDGESRRAIKQIVPSGWHDVEYDFVEGRKLYNRCHLIGYRLTGEHANERNLITGTRYMNHAMRVFENMVADHCAQHGDAGVLFRVTPIYRDDELVARGVQMEALSICEDDAPLQFNVYLHNIQPGVRIDYATGASCRDDSVQDSMVHDCIVNDAAKTFHRTSCPSVQLIKDGRMRKHTGMRQELIDAGYKPCGRCRP